MRIRSIRPEFWRSRSISCLPIEERLLFIGLWSYVDDNGVGLDRLSNIAADLFADDLERDPRETFARVSRGLASLSEHGRITRYTAENVDLLHVTNWDEHQRIDKPGRSRYPLPTTADAAIRESVARVSRDVRESLAPGEGEKGRRGEVKTRSPAAADDPEFDAWWQHYPRKVGKGQARTAYKRATKKTDPPTLLAAVQAFAERAEGSDPKYVPHASTWLNGERWTDQPDQPHIDYSNLTEAEREWYVNNDHAPTPNSGGLTEAELEWEMANR